MENGHDESLAERLSGMGLNDSSRNSDNDDSKNDSLFQVIKAVEAAEATITQQVEENNRLRVELQRKNKELEKYKSNESMSEQPNLGDQLDANVHGSYETNLAAVGRLDDYSRGNQSGGSMINGLVKGPVRSTGLSQFSSPSITSLSPIRTPMGGEHDSHIDLTAHGLMSVAGANNSNSIWKQDLVHKIREQEEEILQLRRHLTDYSVKEAQIRNEKYVLEKRIAYMRLAFDQQQQDLVDAASKALSYRQEIIEENIRLTYALQAAQQERSIFISSLAPLLAEYSLQPQVSDAQSIISSVKVLFRHLQEKLLLTESKLKESEYQLAPWRSDVNQMNVASMFPANAGTGLAVAQQFSHAQAATDNLLHRHPGGGDGHGGMNLESDGPGRNTPETFEQSGANQDEIDGERPSEANKKVKFQEPLSNSEMDEVDAENKPSEINPSYAATFGDPSSSNSPYLQPVLEDPSSSYSEAADDDPLPGIEDLQISGEAFPGRVLQACGFSINGTTSCNFEWVRHLADGSVNYIDGAKQPNYLVTADDVDTYLAIEVQPLDDRKRKGELVKVYANEQQKITCDPEMQIHIEKSFNDGHASYKVSIATGHFDIWEPCTLSIKREGYNIKPSNSTGLSIAEKFSQSTMVAIPFGQPTEFIIVGSDGTEHLLRMDNVTTDVSCSRDAIVLTLRLFAIRAVERRKGKKKGFLFNK